MGPGVVVVRTVPEEAVGRVDPAELRKAVRRMVAVEVPVRIGLAGERRSCSGEGAAGSHLQREGRIGRAAGSIDPVAEGGIGLAEEDIDPEEVVVGSSRPAEEGVLRGEVSIASMLLGTSAATYAHMVGNSDTTWRK